MICVSDMLVANDETETVDVYYGTADRIKNKIGMPSYSDMRDIAVTNNNDLLVARQLQDAIIRHDRITGTAKEVISVYNNPVGVAINAGGSMLTAHYLTTNGSLFLYDGISDIVGSQFALPSSTPIGGIVVDSNGNLISAGRSPSYIFNHDGISDVILGSFPAPNINIAGLGITDDDNLISTDRNGTLYFHQGIGTTILKSISCPFSGNDGPKGVAFGTFTKKMEPRSKFW